MPVHIYTADFREKDGEVLVAEDVGSNLSDIESVANDLDWMNVQGNSLDVYHLAGGEQPKVAKGEYRPRSTIPGTWHEVAVVSVPVLPGDGIYAVGNVVYPGISAASQVHVNGGGSGVHVAMSFLPGSQPKELRIAATTNAPGWAASAGEHRHLYMDNPEVHGQAGIVWAYQVTDLTSLPDGSEHRVSLQVRITGGFPNMPLNPIRASLVVLAVHR